MALDNLNKPMPHVELIVTKTPLGKVVHTEFGTIDHPEGLEQIAITRSKTMGVLNDLEYVKGTQVGLEWRTPFGEKLPTSDAWADNTYIAISPLKGNEKVGKYGQPVTTTAFRQKLRKQNQAKIDNVSPQEYAEWLEQIDAMQAYLDDVKGNAR